MADKGAGLTGRIELVGAEKGAAGHALAVHALAADGKVAGTAKVGADGRFSLPAGALEKAARIVIGDASADPIAADGRFIGYRVAAGLFKRGVLVAGTLLSARTIRIEPALNISYELLDEMLDKLGETLKQIDKQLDKQAKERATKPA